jgi:hypothetical protein
MAASARRQASEATPTTTGSSSSAPADEPSPAAAPPTPPRLHLPPPPPFSGVGQDVESWLATLRRVGPAHGWRPEHDTFVIPALLIGTAATWYDRLTEATKQDAAALWVALLAAFGRPGAAASAREELYARRQRPGETATELAIAVGDLCQRVDPTMPDRDRAQLQLLQHAMGSDMRRPHSLPTLHGTRRWPPGASRRSARARPRPRATTARPSRRRPTPLAIR